MSYIINNSDAFVNVKLTEKGREKLAKGNLNFSYWAIGDSEINYDREDVVDNNPSDPTLSRITKILRPKDRQPDIKSWIYSDPSATTINPLNTMLPSNIKTLKVVVNNEADERGFFSGDSTTGWVTKTGSEYIIETGVVDDSDINGTNDLFIGTTSTVSVGDLILLKISNDTLGSVGLNSNSEPIPHLWYKVQAFSGGTITVDRELPTLNGTGGTVTQYIIYGGGEVYSDFGANSTTSYWDSGTLSFDSACDISCGDVPVWNMNNIWCEDLAGITGNTFETHEYFGSYPYLGQKHPFFEYDCTGDGVSNELKCEGLSELDTTNKSIAVIHYTNNTISNYYGEFFHIDNDNGKTVKIHLPDIMYHRRGFTTLSANTMGMTFLASGDTKYIGVSNLEYVDLIEDPSFLLSGQTAEIVGKVFPQLKMVVIDDEEIVAAMSYKSNRNWTLPALKTQLNNPSGNTSTGLLLQNETMYVTYGFTNPSGSGLTSSLGCQKYSKITNQTATAKDVMFSIEDTGLLKYMRKIEDPLYDGRGFYGYNLEVFYQIVGNDTDRPDPNAWKMYDFTDTFITGNIGETIDPLMVENQNPMMTGFVLNKINNTGATQYDITDMLDLPLILEPEILQFGDEKFFYGNIETYIGATIFKTIFDIRINSGEFIATTNETRSKDSSTNPPNIRVSEVGIYDDNNELVIIGKLSKPIELEAGNTVMIELSMDF